MCFDVRVVVGLKTLIFEVSRSLGRAAGRCGNPLARERVEEGKLIW